MGRHKTFLSHNSGDKPVVEKIARWLEDEANIQVWLDKWHLIPGDPWQEEIEKALDECECCVVFLGPNGIGPWQNEEMRTALDKRVSEKNIRVVPVLLPGAFKEEKESDLPRFLRRLTWVKLHTDWHEDEVLHRLECGIKGIPPGRPEETITGISSFWNSGVLGDYYKRLIQQLNKQIPKPSVVFNITFRDSTQDKEMSLHLLEEFLKDQKKVVLSGPAGCGKSNILRELTLKFSENYNPTIFLNLKRWQSDYHSKKIKTLSVNAKNNSNIITNKFDVLLSTSIGNLSVKFINTTKKKFDFIMVDGLNEIAGTDIPTDIVNTLCEYLRPNSPNTCVVISTREVKRSVFDQEWAFVTVNHLDDTEVKKHVVTVHGEKKYSGLSVSVKELLKTPFFLNMALNSSEPDLISAAKAIESFFIKQLNIDDDTILDNLAESAFDLYKKKKSLSFKKDDFNSFVRDELFEKLKQSGTIKEHEGAYSFDHQLKHDYLAARYLAQNKSKWNWDAFDTVSLESQSFDAISMALEMVKGVNNGDMFLKSVYDWSWIGTMLCIAKNANAEDKLFSRDLKVALKSIIADKFFDPIVGTRMPGKQISKKFPAGDLPNYMAISSDSEIFDFISKYRCQSEWFEEWRRLYLKSPNNTGAKILKETDIFNIINNDSILGWTAANVIRRFHLSECEQRQLRAYFVSFRGNDDRSKTVRWRVVHALGRSASAENIELLLNTLKDEGEFMWAIYGAARSLIEIAAITEGNETREKALKGLNEVLNQYQLPRKVDEEIVKSVSYSGVRKNWESSVNPILETIKHKYKGTPWEKMFENKINEFKKFVKGCEGNE